jgi:hypothetical protein
VRLRFWTSHKIGGGVFYTLLVLHPLPGALRRVENPFALNVSPLEWGYSDTWVRLTTGQHTSDCPFCIAASTRSDGRCSMVANRCLSFIPDQHWVGHLKSTSVNMLL